MVPSSIVKWVYINGQEFDAITNKDMSTLYFIKDRREIYKGDLKFNENICSVTDFPVSNIGINKLYFNSRTKEIKFHDGFDWVSVLSIDSVITEDSSSNAVSADAVKAYIEGKIQDSSLKWQYYL